MDPFLLKLIFSFFVGGAYVALIIRISEKVEPKLAGIITGFPGTNVLSLLFLAWTNDANFALAAMPIGPIGISVNSIYLAILLGLIKFGKFKALIVSLAIWFALILPFVYINFNDFYLAIFISIFIFAIGLHLLSKFPIKTIKAQKLPKRELFLRCILAGSLIAVSVLAGKFLGPLWGGLFATFPAQFSSSVLLLTRTHGRDAAASVAKNIPYGSFSLIAFLIAFNTLLPQIGLISATAISYGVAAIAAVGIYFALIKK
ncbi:DUF3147 family protein [Candidatus Micrarchaeota archaeon]|nr:DUF3147 family protein [Candidatus Micrarchaeota archaeon]